MGILFLRDVLFTQPTEMLLALITSYMITSIKFFDRSSTVRASLVFLFIKLLKSLKCHAWRSTRIIGMPFSLTFETESDFAFIACGLVTAPSAFNLTITIKCWTPSFVLVLNNSLNLVHFLILLYQFIVAYLFNVF